MKLLRAYILVLIVLISVSTVRSTGQIRLNSSMFDRWFGKDHSNLTFNEFKHELYGRMFEWSTELHESLSESESSFEETVKSWFYKLTGHGPRNSIESYDDSDAAKLSAHLEGIIDEFKSGASNSFQWNPFGKSEYPYYGMVPGFRGHLIPGGPAISWEGSCFAKNTAKATKKVDKLGAVHIEVVIETSNPKSWNCADNYLIATGDSISFKNYYFHGKHRFHWEILPDVIHSLRWDTLNKGLRIFEFNDSIAQCLVDVVETALLFIQPESKKIVSESAAVRNLDFLKKYVGVQLSKRTQNHVDIDESLINSGDFVGILRLDGLDPLLAWAMGSHTGHTTIAIRDEYGDLYIAESQAKSEYWPVNGIQRTPFKEWMSRALEADYNVIHAPLSPESRAKFNQTAAMEFFRSVEGVDYGYSNMLWAWTDTLKDNYPCFPNSNDCLKWEHFEVALSWVDILIPKISDLMWNQAWNHRVEDQGLGTADIYFKAAELGMDAQLIPLVPEQDSWTYSLTRNDKLEDNVPSMVCCVFVCRMWKESGLFGDLKDSINCAEFTNWDLYSLNVFDSDRTGENRPQQCIDADPDNELCQLAGKYTLNLNDFNTKAPHKHMAEHCPSLGPKYIRDPTC